MTKQFQPTRRGLFRGIAQKAQGKPVDLSVLRPPGAIEEANFTQVCDRCDQCIQSCPQRVLVRGDGGYPELNFLSAGCSFCDKCIEVCPTDALSTNGYVQRLGELELKENCLPKSGITCQSCKDVCEAEAIEFPMTIATPLPKVLADACTGCGECVSICPVNAIDIKPVAQPERVNA